MRLLIALSYLLAAVGFGCIAHAQLLSTGAGRGQMTSAAFVGPGDVAPGAYFWGGLRAYSAAKRGTPAVRVCDGSQANCVDVNSDAVTGKVVITSTTVSGIDCTASTACTISQLYDQSGNSRTMFGGGGAAFYPNLKTGCTARAQPCAMFSNAQNSVMVTDPAALLTLNQPWSLSFWNWNTNTGARGDLFYDDTISGSCGTGQTIVAYNVSGTANQIDAFAGTGLLVTVPDAAWNSLGIVSAATGKVSVNGAAPSTGSMGTNNITAKTAAIGQECSLAGTNKWNGFLTEIGAWASDISANFSAISTNQTAFY